MLIDRNQKEKLECSKQSKQCRLIKASESVRETQGITSGWFYTKHSYRQSDQIERLRPKCAFNGRLESFYLIQWRWGATASYEHREICTRQWLRLSLTAVCKIKCFDKAFFVPWHSRVEMQAPNPGGEKSKS